MDFFQPRGSATSSARSDRANVFRAMLSHPPPSYEVRQHGNQHPSARDLCSRGCSEAGGPSCLRRMAAITEPEKTCGRRLRARMFMGHRCGDAIA
jgi:hypothetical protein